MLLSEPYNETVREYFHSAVHAGRLSRDYPQILESVAAESGQGSYRGKPVKSLRAVRTLKPWRGQTDYRPLGRIWLE